MPTSYCFTYIRGPRSAADNLLPGVHAVTVTYGNTCGAAINCGGCPVPQDSPLGYYLSHRLVRMLETQDG